MGPALVLRAIFAELNRDEETGSFSTGRLLQAAGLQTLSICAASGMPAGPDCPRIDKNLNPAKPQSGYARFTRPWLRRQCPTKPVYNAWAGRPSSGKLQVRRFRKRSGSLRHRTTGLNVRSIQPTPGLQIAVDPRIPAESRPLRLRFQKESSLPGSSGSLTESRSGKPGKMDSGFVAAFPRRVHPAGQGVARRPERSGLNPQGGVRGEIVPRGSSYSAGTP